MARFPLPDIESLPDWLELDYFRTVRPVRRWRRGITWALILGCAGVLAVLLLVFGQRKLVQAGPLSPAHVAFNADCQRCHGQAFSPAGRFLPRNAHVETVSDSTCLQCHPAGPHANGKAAEPGCASCHREHRGKPLAVMADEHCSQCHADLSSHLEKGEETSQPQTVTLFSGDHPEFPALNDPGHIHFPHEVHLDPKRMVGESLACESCHVPDADKRYMEPIRYQSHCRRCHELDVGIAGDWSDKKITDSIEKFAAESAPHQSPDVVRAVMRNRIERFVEENPDVLDPKKQVKKRNWIPRPGRALEMAATTPPQNKEQWIKEQVRGTEAALFQGKCLECHQQDLNPPSKPDDLPRFKLSNINVRWYKHSKFNHGSHRALECIECHAGVTHSQTEQDVLLPARATCTRCHNQTIGVRSSCTTCHDYHRQEKSWIPKEQVTIDQFIHSGENAHQ
jgi:hypothetical protein